LSSKGEFLENQLGGGVLYIRAYINFYQDFPHFLTDFGEIQNISYPHGAVY
jgi:hypothetical protein